MKKLLVLALFIPSVAFAQDSNTHHKNHNSYKEWKTPNGTSCCDDKDCDIVKELGIDPSSNLLKILWRGREYLVPEHRKLKDVKSPDGNSHACIVANMVNCFVQGDQMF